MRAVTPDSYYSLAVFDPVVTCGLTRSQTRSFGLNLAFRGIRNRHCYVRTVEVQNNFEIYRRLRHEVIIKLVTTN